MPLDFVGRGARRNETRGRGSVTVRNGAGTMAAMSPRDLDSDYDAEPPRRRRSRPTNFTPLFAVVAMMVAAILGASFIFNKRKAIEEDRAEEQRLAGEFNGAPMPFEDRGRVDAEDLFLDLIAETGPNVYGT